MRVYFHDYANKFQGSLCKNVKLKVLLQNTFTFTFTFMHLADAFIQSDLHCIQVTALHFISSCFPWESNR